jgi:predicted  nucleic acid-binding Zn-ribbon protein
MHVTMVREAWTDERLDDLAKGVGEVRAEVIELRKEVGHVREELGELRAEIKALTSAMDTRFNAQQKYMDAKFDGLNRTMQIGFSLIGGALGLIGMVLAALVGLIAI